MVFDNSILAASASRLERKPPLLTCRRRPSASQDITHSRDLLGGARCDGTAFDASRRAATKACEASTGTVGRVHQIEPHTSR